MSKIFLISTLASVMLLASCAGDETPTSVAYRLKVTVSGLPFGESVLLYNNQSDALETELNGQLTQFPSTLSAGENYAVTIKKSPPGNNCVVNNGEGVISSDVDNITVVCKPLYNVSTIIASAFPGYGPGKKELISDNNGGFFYNDTYNHAIYRMSSDGELTLFAGAVDEAGIVDGDATTARFYYPQSLALDSSGNLYVIGFLALRKIDTSGNVTTVAGGFENPLNNDGMMVIDDEDNLYIGDYYKIKKLDLTSGIVSDFVTLTTTNGIRGMTLGLNNTLYYTDNYTNVIWQVDSSGMVTEFVGSGFPTIAEGTGTEASVNGWGELFSDTLGNIYGAYPGQNGGRSMVKISPTGVLTIIYSATVWGIVDSTETNAGLISWPRSPVVDNDGNIFFQDERHFRKLTPNN